MSEQSSNSSDQPAEALASPSLESTAVTPAPDAKWEDLGLSEASLALIRKAGYTKPTAVQVGSIPLALAGEDVISSAQTGTGKTASFVLPMVDKFVGREGTFGLILAPTREIAQQIQATIEILGAPRGVRSIVLIGGINMRLDALALDTYPQIIVATPGRLCDHLDRGNVWLDYIEMVVLDEADRMLDMGFADQLARIIEDVPETKQTLLFSATIPPSVDRLAKKILRNPKAVAIGKPLSANKAVEQRLFWLSEDSKNRELQRLLRQDKGRTIVFTRSKDGATRVWRSLHSAGFYDATYIHSDRLQSHREQALADFKTDKYRILVATDVAGRGIHVEEVSHVINYDLPMEPEDYIHRIGRTGRAGNVGKATTFVTPRDRRNLAEIEKLLGHPIPPVNSPAPEGEREQRSDRDRGGRSPRRDDRPAPAPRPTPSPSGSGVMIAPIGSQPAASRPAAAPGAAKAPEASEGGEGAPRRRRRRGGKDRNGSPAVAPVSAASFAYPDDHGAPGDDEADEPEVAGAPGAPVGEGEAPRTGKRRRGRRGGRGRNRNRGPGGEGGGPEGGGTPPPSGGSGPSFPV